MPGRLVFSTTGDGGDGSVERMRINSAGNVGIGTTNPFVGLSVENSSLMVATSHDTINSTIVWANPGVYREGVYISYDASNDKGRIASVRPNVGYSDLSLVGTNLYLNTSTGSGTTAATRVTILAAGNVGIGKTTPREKLDVHGNIAVNNEITFEADCGADYKRGATVVSTNNIESEAIIPAGCLTNSGNV